MIDYEVISSVESEEYCFQCDTQMTNLKLVIRDKYGNLFTYNTCLTCASCGCEIKSVEKVLGKTTRCNK